MKRCPKCGETKPFEAFSKAAKNKDGLHGHCKACVSERNKNLYAQRGKKSWMTESQCVRCNRLLPKSMFDKHGRSCRDCLAFEDEQHAKGLKQCNSCHGWLTHDKFHPSKIKVYRTTCKECTRDVHEGRKDKARESRLKKEYGITLAQYAELVAKQGYKCPVCEKPLEPGNWSYPVDHSHGGPDKGRIRGVVHRDCNRFVLWTHEDSTMLRNAANLIDNPLTDWFVPGPTYNENRWKRNKK